MAEVKTREITVRLGMTVPVGDSWAKIEIGDTETTLEELEEGIDGLYDSLEQLLLQKASRLMDRTAKFLKGK